MSIFFVLFFLLDPVHATELKSVQVVLGEPLVAPKNIDTLKTLRQFIVDGKKAECLEFLPKVERKWPILKGWLTLFKLRCHDRQFARERKSYTAALELEKALWKDRESLYGSVAASELREELIDFTWQIFEFVQKNDRDRFWYFFDRLMDVQAELSGAQRAKMYLLAAEVCVLEQNLSLARDYYERSLSEDSAESVRSKYEALLKKMEPSLASGPLLPRTSPSYSSPTVEEREVYERMSTALKGNDLLVAVQDGVRLIHDYPGGKNASEAAKSIIGVYLGLISKPAEKYQALKEQVLTEMRRADEQRISDWAQIMISREKFDDALFLVQEGFAKDGGLSISAKVLLQAGLSAHHAVDYPRAREYYSQLIKRHSGTAQSAEALYRLGLLEFRDERYAEAATNFESFLQYNEGSDFELSALYWLWRSLQKTAAQSADDVAQKITKKYPLSYYAVRVRAEMQNQKVNFPPAPERGREPRWAFSLTPRELAIWERYLALRAAGFYPEARAELAQIPEPALPLGKLLYASLWSEAQDYVRSSEILARTFMLDSSLISAASLRVAYPIQYFEEIKKEAAKFKYPPEIIMSLIKQESSYRADVRSPAGALGLMQIMPETGREIASDLRIKSTDIARDLINPLTNIRIGTHYFQRLLRAMTGNVPLALGAYNAGIGNIRSWQNARRDLTTLEKGRSSSPREELWIDELPWSETSGYIKSILRNYLVYRFLDQGEYLLPDPVWTLEN